MAFPGHGVGVVTVLFLCLSVSLQQQGPSSQTFLAAAGSDGVVTAAELQLSLPYANIFGLQAYSLEACRHMLNRHDRDRTNNLDFSEFSRLWEFLLVMIKGYLSFDQDDNRTFDVAELQTAIMGYFNLNAASVRAIMSRYSVQGRMTFDNFLIAFIKLELLRAEFQRRVQSQSDQALFQYNDFIQIVTLV